MRPSTSHRLRLSEKSYARIRVRKDSRTAMLAENGLARDPVESAREASLRYVTDATPGIVRRPSGKGFRYTAPDGSAIRDSGILSRIRSLAIPPAWTSVWICPSPDGHLQATGRDARGRKQYRYHPHFRSSREETKYNRLLLFADALPAIRERVEKDLMLGGLCREKVLAVVVRLLETTLIRVGNREYTRDNGSFGLTTMRGHHVAINGSTLSFEFRGKSGKWQSIRIDDRRLARLVRRCQDIPGQELFQYYDAEGRRQRVDSADVNAYLREITGQDFTAKDFRTWGGTVFAALALREMLGSGAGSPTRTGLLRAIENVAQRLGNTRAICRKCYVHPAVIEAYMEGVTIPDGPRKSERERPGSRSSLRPEEAAVMTLLRRRISGADAKAQARAL